MAKQHKRALQVTIKQGDYVMIQQSERNSKLSPKFVGPYKVVRYIFGNKFEILDPQTNTTLVAHSDRLKLFASSDTPVTDPVIPVEDANMEHECPSESRTSHSYNLRSRV